MKTKILLIVSVLGLNVIAQASDWTIRRVQVPGGIISYSVSGTTCTITAEPSADYKFVQWLDDATASQTRIIDFSDQSITSPAMTFRAAFAYVPATEMTEGPISVTLVDEAIPSYSLTVSPTSPSSHPFSHWNNGLRTTSIVYTEQEGLVIPRFAGISVNTPMSPGGKVTYQYAGYLYTLTAIPNPDYRFQQWADGETANPRIVSAMDIVGDGSVAYRAVFVHQPSVHFNRGDVTVSVQQESPLLFNLSLEQCDYETFSCWSNASQNLSVDYVEENGHVVPYFLKALPENTPDFGGHIDYEEIKCGYRMTAVSDNGYSFSKWENNSTNPIREVDLSEADYQAYFVSGAYQVGDDFYGALSDAIEAADNEHPVVIWLDKSDDAVIDKEVSVSGEGHQIGDLTILNGAQLHLTSSLLVNNLYLNTTTSSSSQLTGEQYMTYNHAYVDVTLEAGKDVASPDLWYAFAVPFEVSIPEGIHRKSYPAAPTLVSGEDFLIWEYDGQMRADNQENGWKQMPSGTLKPGNFYMIGIGGTENTWRFAKKESTPLVSENVASLFEFPSVDFRHAGWNAVGNSSLTYADASTANGIQIAQVYENGAETANYRVEHFAESSFVVGSPFFVQTAGDDELQLTSATHLNKLLAPARNQRDNEYYKIQILSEGEVKDAVFLTTDEEAISEYTIGKDVMKIFGGNANTYLYTNAYDMKLCAEYAPRINGNTDFHLGVYAPQAGSYKLQLAKSANATVYLTHNNVVIWNLSKAPYELELGKGTTLNYGIKICYMPELTTSVENNQIHSSNAQKFIDNGVLYINANGVLYNTQGFTIGY